MERVQWNSVFGNVRKFRESKTGVEEEEYVLIFKNLDPAPPSIPTPPYSPSRYLLYPTPNVFWTLYHNPSPVYSTSELPPLARSPGLPPPLPPPRPSGSVCTLRLINYGILKSGSTPYQKQYCTETKTNTNRPYHAELLSARRLRSPKHEYCCSTEGDCIISGFPEAGEGCSGRRISRQSESGEGC